jgi:hypothetical protein
MSAIDPKRTLGDGTIVSSAFCVEGISADPRDVDSYVEKACQLLRRGGGLVMTVATGCSRYRVGSRYYPCTCISDSDLIALLGRHRICVDLHGRMCAPPSADYDGITAVRGVKA